MPIRLLAIVLINFRRLPKYASRTFEPFYHPQPQTIEHSRTHNGYPVDCYFSFICFWNILISMAGTLLFIFFFSSGMILARDCPSGWRIVYNSEESRTECRCSPGTFGSGILVYKAYVLEHRHHIFSNLP